MKICKINFKNIHSLKGEHSVDFANGILGDAGLFVITGPTGAGKSTLLDVITLALYNKIPRIDKAISKNVIEEEGIILTKHTNDCYAEVEFLVNNIKYRANWSISRTSKGTLKERLHEIVNVTENNTIISNKISETLKEIEQIIGLTYEQFIQSMLLAQGQFSKLLLAKKDDRNALLEEITGTSIYRSIGKQVHEKYTQVKRAEADHRLIMGENTILSEEALSEIKQELEICVPKLTLNQQKETLILKKKEVKNSILKLNIKRNELHIKKTEIEAEQKSLAPLFSKLEIHAKFVHLRTPFLELIQFEKSFIQHQKNIEQFEVLENKLKNEAILILGNAEKLCQTEITELNFESILQNFQKTITALLDKEKQFEYEINAELLLLKDKAKILANLDYVLTKTAPIEEQVERFKTHIQKESNLFQIFDLETLKKKKEENSKLKSVANQIIAERKLANYAQNIIQKSKSDIEEFTSKINTLQLEFEAITKQENTVQEQVIQEKIKLETAQKIKSFDQLRLELEENCACPLCGSTNHPFVNQHQEIVLDAQQLAYDLLEKNLQNIRKNKTTIEATLNSHSKFIENTEQKMLPEELNLQKSTTKIQNLNLDLMWKMTETLEKWEADLDEMHTFETKLIQLENGLQAKIHLEALSDTYKKKNEIEAKLKATQQERTNLFTGTDIVTSINSLKDNFNSCKIKSELNQNQLVKEKSATKELQTKMEAATFELIEKTANLGLSNWKELEEKIVSEDEATQLTAKIKAVNDKEVALKSNLETTNLELKKEIEKDDNSINSEELQLELVTLQHEIETQKEQKWELENQLKVDLEKREKQKHNQIILDKLLKDLNLWSKMYYLIGDATGKKFSNFVQELTLKQLLDYGNARLQHFSDRYLLSMDSESDSLKVMDSYMGNTERAVASLSGGETFKLSLALAFGLSDLAAKNVNIESLFIDEGFGTLDPESLDQAISILENMQNTSNKSIGIISHVGELKDRIAAKIKLEKTGAGFSSIVVE